MRNQKFAASLFYFNLKNNQSKLLGPLFLSVFLTGCEESSFGSVPKSKPDIDTITRISDEELVYRRHDYMDYWVDKDGDCRNLRHEMLMRQSLEEVTFKNTKNCIYSWCWRRCFKNGIRITF